MSAAWKLKWALLALTVCMGMATFKNTTAPPEEKCSFEPDSSTVETRLRSAILSGDVKKAAKIFSSNKTFSLAAGSTYKEEHQCLIVQSEQREKDPDVVAFRAAALNAYKTGNTFKIAKTIATSFIIDCATCEMFTAHELDQIVEDFKSFLDDKENIKEVLFGDPSKDGGKRRLLATEQSPTNSFFCAYCYPQRACTKLRWCG